MKLWEPVWEEVSGMKNYACKDRGYLLKSNAIRWGNHMSNEYGWGPFCVRIKQPRPEKTNYFTGVCDD